jgi:hypothetical protein
MAFYMINKPAYILFYVLIKEIVVTATSSLLEKVYPTATHNDIEVDHNDVLIFSIRTFPIYFSSMEIYHIPNHSDGVKNMSIYYS